MAPDKPTFIAILLNRATDGFSCWAHALAFLRAIHSSEDIRTRGVFITGQCVNDVIAHELPDDILQEVRRLNDSGIPFLLCSSRLPDKMAEPLPAGFASGSLGQWMEWLESSQRVVEWA